VVLDINSPAKSGKRSTTSPHGEETEEQAQARGHPDRAASQGELELVVGSALDAEMGPVVLFGTGGVDIELMKDTALRWRSARRDGGQGTDQAAPRPA